MLKKIASVIPFPRRRTASDIASDEIAATSGQLPQPDAIATRSETASETASDDVGPGITIDQVTTETVFDVHGLTPRQRVELFLKVVLAELDVIAKKHGCARGDQMPQQRLHRRYMVMAQQCAWPPISQKGLTTHLEKLGCIRIRLNDKARTTVIQLPK